MVAHKLIIACVHTIMVFSVTLIKKLQVNMGIET